MQLESNRFSVGKVSPLETACLSLSSASRADLSYQNVTNVHGDSKHQLKHTTTSIVSNFHCPNPPKCVHNVKRKLVTKFGCILIKFTGSSTVPKL